MKIDCLTDYEKVIRRSNNVLDSILYADSTSKFKITKQKDGGYPAVITISGYLSEDLDNRLDWEHSVRTSFPDREWFHIEWNSQKYPFKNLTSNKLIIPLEFETVKKSKILSHFLEFKVIKIIINNSWHLAVRNSKHAGRLLGKSLVSCDNKQFILVGHSLGARVIHNCLEYISEQKGMSNVIDIHLLGGAVSNREKKWKRVSMAVMGNAYNYFSRNDSVLRELYSTIMIDDYPVGLSPVESHKFRNVDSSKFISGHTEYIRNFHIIRHK